MKSLIFLSAILSWSVAAFAADPVPAPPGTETPPPAAPPQRSAADLEKLVGPIALYPDPLIATILPASVYPLEIVQAARFVKDTNNLAQLDAQPWDSNVKAVARVPAVIEKMNGDISWTMELGEAFLVQDKDLMDAIQRLRGKAQTVGTLQTSPQQVVIVTNVVVEKTIEQQVVVVTNTVVQIQPADPQVVYVPQYNPTAVYAPPPPTADPAATLVTFGVGMLVGAAIADNNCDWYHGGCYGGYHGDVDIDINNNVNINRSANVNQNANVNRSTSANSARSGASAQASAASAPKKWQPDQSRLGKSGSPTAAASARTGAARGWSSPGASPSAASSAARAPSGATAARPSTASASARPSPSTASASARPTPTTGSASANARPSAGASSASRPSASPTASQARPSPSGGGATPSASAFSGASSGRDARSASSRGSSSRSSSSGGRSTGSRR
ncbi:MAG: DUF3300 domain-containing protein [Verrucomicrobiia bacterium]